MDTEFVSCPDNSCDVKQEVLDEVDPLAVSSEVNIEFAEYMIKVDNVEEPAECMGVEDCGVMVKQEIIEVVEDMKVELDEESDDVKKLVLCEICGDFTSPWCRKQHEETSRETETSGVEPQNLKISDTSRRLFICKFCYFKTDDGSEFEAHLAAHVAWNMETQETIRKQFETNKLKSCQTTQMKETTGKCNICTEMFVCCLHLRKDTVNRVNREKFQCDQCKFVSFRLDTLQTHMANHTGGMFVCNVCEKAFPHFHLFKKHELIHTRKLLLECKFCNYYCTERDQFKKHMTIHLFTCDVCVKEFSSFSNLSKHKSTHQGKLIKCTLCSFSCDESDELKRHVAIHNGDKPYQCDVCGKGFLGFFRLRSHKMKCSTNRNKLFKCTHCSHSYNRYDNLTKHMKKQHKLIQSREEAEIASTSQENSK